MLLDGEQAVRDFFGINTPDPRDSIRTALQDLRIIQRLQHVPALTLHCDSRAVLDAAEEIAREARNQEPYGGYNCDFVYRDEPWGGIHVRINNEGG